MDGNQKRKGDFGESSTSKKAKNDDFMGVQPSRFESELASLHSSDAGTTSVALDPKTKWKRPPLPAIDPAKDSIEFQQLDVENYIGKYHEQNLNFLLHS